MQTTERPVTGPNGDNPITNDQLVELFGVHCECRPLDPWRDSDDHAAVHNCDTDILGDIQSALFDGDDDGAYARCVSAWNARHGAHR